MLLVAEPGCGVELCARFLHRATRRGSRPMTTRVLAEAPLELLTQAREGTLFLHEVADLTRVEQKGLLLLLSKLDRYNARLMCATRRGSSPSSWRPASSMRGSMRRFPGRPIRVPSLREHREDVPDIANLVLSQMIEAKEVAAARVLDRRAERAAQLRLARQSAPAADAVQTLAQTALGEQITLEDVERALPQPDAPRPARARARRSTCRCATRATRSSASISSTTSARKAATSAASPTPSGSSARICTAS